MKTKTECHGKKNDRGGEMPVEPENHEKRKQSREREGSRHFVVVVFLFFVFLFELLLFNLVFVVFLFISVGAIRFGSCW